MKFSLFNLMPMRDATRTTAAVLADTVDMVKLAEQIGFKCAWFAEHHFGNYCMCPSPLVMAAHCAPVTSTIELGTGVIVMPLYHPLRLVEEIGLVDNLCGGRLTIGLGSGYQDYEFSRYGVPLSDRWERTHEMLDILEMAFERGHVAYAGTFYRVDDAPIALRPQGEKEIYVAGNQPEMLTRMAASGYIPFATAGSAPIDAIVGIKSHVGKYMGSDGDFPFAIQRMVYVTDDKSEALRVAENRLYTDRLVHAFRDGREIMDGWQLVAEPFENEPDLESIIANNAVGDAETCAERILRDIDAVSPSEYSCFFHMGDMDAAKSLAALERFGADVMPIVEKELRCRRS